MAERKNTEFDRPGGYATPRGATQIQRESAADMPAADIRMLGDEVAAYVPATVSVEPAHRSDDPDTRLYIGDCRDVIPNLPDHGQVDLVFAFAASHLEHQRCAKACWQLTRQQA